MVMSLSDENDMIDYDAAKPLISLHVPKCGGQAFRRVLEKWFGDRFFIHYFQQGHSLPHKHPLKPGICIHGHFNQARGFGVMDYYPEADQFIAVLRDPIEAAVSNYFFWKRKARSIQLINKMMVPGGEQDYRDIDDFFRKRPRSNMLDFMPRMMTKENYRETIETKFVWIGLVEKFQMHVDGLAEALGFSTGTVDRLNASSRDEVLSSAARQAFLENNPLEFEIYRYVKDRFMEKEEG